MRAVREAVDAEGVAQPLRDAADGLLFCKIQCGPQGGAVTFLYCSGVRALIIQQYQIGIGLQGVICMAAEVIGGVDAGVQPDFLAVAFE